MNDCAVQETSESEMKQSETRTKLIIKNVMLQQRGREGVLLSVAPRVPLGSTGNSC